MTEFTDYTLLRKEEYDSVSETTRDDLVTTREYVRAYDPELLRRIAEAANTLVNDKDEKWAFIAGAMTMAQLFVRRKTNEELQSIDFDT